MVFSHIFNFAVGFQEGQRLKASPGGPWTAPEARATSSPAPSRAWRRRTARGAARSRTSRRSGGPTEDVSHVVGIMDIHIVYQGYHKGYTRLRTTVLLKHHVDRDVYLLHSCISICRSAAGCYPNPQLVLALILFRFSSQTEFPIKIIDTIQ